MKIEQMLHGYDNGHRLLAGSVLLKDSMDMDTVAFMSDWSEYVDSGDSSYLTAYPLKGSNYYVVAKTWYADEMKRPGCVWTHSLLISIDDLDSVDDFSRLRTLFVRPKSAGTLDNYSHTIEYDNRDSSENDYEVLKVDRILALQALLCFINAECSSVGTEVLKDKDVMERLMLSVMNVLPQKFLIRLSWCTGTAYQRKLNGIPLTWQFLTRDRDNNAGAKKKEEPWMTYVLDGILRGDVNQGQLLRMFSEDIQEREDNYVAIVTMLYTLEDYFKSGERSEVRYGQILSCIAKNFPVADEGIVIKKLSTNRAFSDRYCEDERFFYYFCTLPLDGVFDITETKVNERWAEFVERNRSDYLPFLNKLSEAGYLNGWGIQVLKESVEVMSDEEVITAIKTYSNLFTMIALLNPMSLCRIEWNKLGKEDLEVLLPLILDARTRGNFYQWEELFKVLLTNVVDFNDQLSKMIFEGTDNATNVLLDYVNENTSRYVGAVFGRQLRHYERDVLKWLKCKNSITNNVAYAISQVVNEHSPIVVSEGARIWKPYLGLQYNNLQQEVYAFLFILSFNWMKDMDALKLMRMSFYPLHVLQASGHLKYSIWSQILPCLDNLFVWEDWDRCKKLRKTVVRRLKEAGLERSVVEHFTPDDNLNELLRENW